MIVYGVWSGRIWGICSNMIVYVIVYGRMCSNMVRYDRVCDRICWNMVKYDRVSDLIWSYMFEYGPIWSSMWSYMWSFLCCSEVQLFRVPEVSSFPGFPRFPSFQGFQVSKVPLAQCWVNVGQLESVCSWGYVCRVEKVLVDQHSRWISLNNTKSLLRPRPTLASQSGPNQLT
jgi:hypothetical protein